MEPFLFPSTILHALLFSLPVLDPRLQLYSILILTLKYDMIPL